MIFGCMLPLLTMEWTLDLVMDLKRKSAYLHKQISNHQFIVSKSPEEIVSSIIHQIRPLLDF
jgi:hypothetical protein